MRENMPWDPLTWKLERGNRFFRLIDRDYHMDVPDGYPGAENPTLIAAG